MFGVWCLVFGVFGGTGTAYCISLNPHSIAATAPTGAGLDGSPNTEIMGLLKPFSVARYMQRPTTEPDSDQSESEETILVADIDSHLILQIFPARSMYCAVCCAVVHPFSPPSANIPGMDRCNSRVRW